MKTIGEKIQKSNTTTQILDVTDETYNIDVKVWKKDNVVTAYISSSSIATAISKGTMTETLASLPARI